MTINEELREICNAAHFTPADMGAWCNDLDRSTMRMWINGRNQPHPIKHDYLKAEISLLRKVLADQEGKLPIPINIRKNDRKQYVLQVKNYAIEKFLAGRDPIRGV